MPSHHPSVLLLTVIALTACRGGEDTAHVTLDVVCGDRNPVELLSERLRFVTPSQPFDIGDEDEVFVAVTFDPQFNQGGFTPSPWDLYVIDASAQPDIDESSPLRANDPRISISDIDAYERVSQPAGSYRLYSRGSPEVNIIRCE
jgi:hypothetical protein